MKKILSLILAAALLLSLCSFASAEDWDAKSEAVWAEKWADVDTSEHVVIMANA